MRVALVSPSMDMGQLGRFSPLLEPMPVLGLAYLVGALRRAGHQVDVFDQFASGESSARLIRRVVDGRPDAVGISVLTPSAPLCAAIAAG